MKWQRKRYVVNCWIVFTARDVKLEKELSASLYLFQFTLGINCAYAVEISFLIL